MLKNTTVQSEKEKMIARYKKAYRCTDDEAQELYVFDTKYCDKDEDTKAYLIDHCGMKKEKVDELFYKSTRLLGLVMPTSVSKEVTAKTKADQASRTKFIAERIEAEYKFLFGELVAEDESTLEYNLPDGKQLTIKLAKHKTQKVVTKEVKRRGLAKDAAGKPVPTSPTDVELRCMALENVLRENPELFVALSVAGSQCGYAMVNGKYPFGSVKMTHHKD